MGSSKSVLPPAAEAQPQSADYLSLLERTDLGPRSLEERVTTLLREMVIGAKIPSSTEFRIGDISSRLGCSVTPVSNALRRLEAEGYVQILARRGFVVCPLSIEELEELTVQRRAVECLAAEKSVPLMTADDITAIRAAAHALEEAIDGQADDVMTVLRLDQQFHLSLYRPSGRARLLDTITRLRDRSRAYLHLANSQSAGHVSSHSPEHTAMVSACEQRDTEGVVALISRHSGNVMETVRPLLHPDEDG